MAHHQRIHLGDADSLAVVRRHSPTSRSEIQIIRPPFSFAGNLDRTHDRICRWGRSFVRFWEIAPSQCPLPESHAKVIPRFTSNMSQSAFIAPAFAPNSAVALVETDEEECCKPADQHKLPEPKEIHLNSFWRNHFTSIRSFEMS